ncbi:MAG TPA: ATP-binding protein [Ramlibacter sp.]|jgi:signal transduction histidine kinase/HAMP domain-containing protein|nr:ATP-binding protein [Ramlibacter sp.]
MKLLPGSLGRKYAIYFVSVVGMALLVSGLVQLLFTYRENQAAVLNLQAEKAAFAGSRIEAYVREIERQLGWMRFPRPEGTGADQIRLDYLKLLRQVPAITDVVLLDAQGKEQVKVSRVSVDVVDPNADHSRDPRFLVPKKGETYFGPVYFRKGTEPYMTIAVAESGRSGGVTVAEVNLKFIWDVVSRIRVGEKGGAYVVDERGHLIAHPDISFVLRNQDLSSLPQVAAARGPGGQDPQVTRSPEGHRVLSAHAAIPSLRWLVFVEQPVEEALAPVYGALRRTGLLFLLGLGLAVMASVYVSRRMVKPIMAIGAGAEVLAGGDLSHRIEIRTGDELEGLAHQVNHLAATLGDLYGSLERKVEQRTGELSEALRYQTAVSDVLRQLSQFPSDAESVFRVILDNASRLLGSEAAAVLSYDGQAVDLVATRGWTPVALKDAERVYPAAPGAQIVGADAILQLRPVAVDDTQAGGVPASAASFGWRRLVTVPMLKEGRAVGAIALGWAEPGTTPAKDVEVLRTFADQAVIAVESVRLVNEIKRKSAELEVAGKHKSEFLASMSHELRTPLNAVIGFSEALLEEMFGGLNEKQAEYLRDIHSSGTHLLSLINDILDLSKIEAGRMDLELSAFSVPAALESTMTLMRERASRGQVALSLQCGTLPPQWVADERKFKQIMINLLSNAVKFTPAGGRVSVSAAEAGDTLEIAVADTGVGIKPEDRELVFEEFRQASGNHLAKVEGTGLGLALTRKLVELHGGSIELHSEVGRGSTFVVRLPQQEVAVIQ